MGPKWEHPSGQMLDYLSELASGYLWEPMWASLWALQLAHLSGLTLQYLLERDSDDPWRVGT